MNEPPDLSTGLSPEADLREALSFLGHNAREGHSTTLALLELQRIKPDPMAMPDLIDRVERNARKSLAAIDDFMDLARARNQALRIEELDLADLLVELVADAWSLASRHGIRVQIASSVDSAPVRADRELLTAAIAKLLRDSAARTPRGVDIQCALIDAANEWVIAIGDPGAPDTPQAAADTSPWDSKLPHGERVGPGLALAQVVAKRHGGQTKIEPNPGAGRTLRLSLPRP